MIFESLWPLALLLAVPIVIILYLLVPKGEDTKISSNLLWEKLFRNQQSKTFWEKFIHNLLMYLQIVIILLLVLALMSPYISKKGGGSGSVVYVLDTSGSMQHRTAEGDTRIQTAVDEMKKEIAASEGAKFSIVTCSGMETDLLVINSSDKRSIYRALDKVECTDAEGNFSDAAGAVQALLGEEQKGNVVVYTDGIGQPKTGDFTDLLSAEVRVMGDEAFNVANTFLSCTKDENGYTAAAGLVNYSDVSARLELSLYEGERVLEIRSLTLDPDASYTCLFQNVDCKGEVLHTQISSVVFEGSEREDSLTEDNCAYALLDEASQIDAVLVGEGNLFIEKAYQAVTGQSLVKLQKADALDEEAAKVRIYDAKTAALQSENISRMVFADPLRSADKIKNVSLMVSDTQLTSGISNFAIGVNETNIYDLPEWATGFLWSGDDCAGYYGEHDGIRQVVIGFDIRESDFALQPEFPVFMANALSFLSDSSLLAQSEYEAGDTVLFHPQADFDVNTLSAATAKAGCYEVKAGDKKESYVVRFSTSQSDGRITAEGTKGANSYQGQQIRKQLRNVLLFVALLLLLIEWILYVRQMRYRGKFYFGVRLAMFALVVLAMLGLSVKRHGSADTTIFIVDISNSNEQNLEAMDDHLSEMIEKMPDKNQYGIVTFGKNALVEQFLTQDSHFSEIMSMPDKTATNLEDAVLRGLSMIPEDTAGRLVILTDGKETKGNLESTASALVSREVELLSVVYDVTQGNDAYIENVELPAYLYAGDAYSMTVTVVSNYDTDASLQIWMGSEQKKETNVHLNKGTNQFVLKQKVSGENAESFEVRVAAPDDSCGENNSFRAYAAVNSLPKVLVISGMKEDSGNFSALLSGAGCNYRVVSALNAPDTLTQMLEYKTIILENVYRTDLPEGFLENLDTYVKDYGCGVVCCGGEESFALGGYRDTELEKILPVDMELRGVNEIPTLAMVMVIDHSGSMSESAGDGSGATNLDLAITAANLAVDQLRDQDYVGVVTFDDKYSWQLPITLADDKDEIHEKIRTVKDGGGTTIKPALRAALSEIVKSDADIRHVVLLTDGQGETNNFEDIIQDYQKEKVTLSTVAVGTGADSRLLERIADGCDGRYYYSDIATDIPKIFAQEVFLSGDTYLQNGNFSLQVNSGNVITRGLFVDGWPNIGGYVSATPKASSNVLIASDKDDPVLTVMQYGLGHTVSWNTDVTNSWTKNYANQTDYVQLWKRIIDYSAGNAGIGEDSVDVATAGGSTKINYRAVDYTEQTTVEAVYTDPDGQTQTVKLQASAPGEYEADIPTEQTGVYNLSVRRLNNGEIVNAMTGAAVVQYADEYKFALTNDKFCAFVKQYGQLIKPEDNFWKKRNVSSHARRDLTRWLIILAVLWFIADIAFRRFCFDPKRTKLYRMAVQRWTNRGKRDIITTEKLKQPQEVIQQAEVPVQTETKTKDKKPPKKDKKKEDVVLDTSALLKKKEQRHQ